LGNKLGVREVVKKLKNKKINSIISGGYGQRLSSNVLVKEG
jgi:hypothetical protein